MMKRKSLTKQDVNDVLSSLEELYRGAKSELEYENPFQLLIATILAAQCTDKRVNQVTAPLFKVYQNPNDFLTLSEEQLGEKIKSCGFYNSKSKNILATCKILQEKHHGEVPNNREELMKLPGVGRKTANVVISNAFQQPAIAVDTHVFRVSNRLGLAKSKDVNKVEESLMKKIPKDKWSEAHHWLIYHGRRVCKARKPQCEICPLQEKCVYYNNEKNQAKT